MPAIVPKKVLLVEGSTEKRLIPELMEQRGVHWVLGPNRYAVRIDVAGGPVTARVTQPSPTDGQAPETDQEDRAPSYVGTYLKESNLGALGVIFDADAMHGRAENRWEQMKGLCRGLGVDLPDDPLPGGYIVTLPGGVRFGVWMMPDNRPPGMLETFLLSLLREEEIAGELYQHARQAVDRAKELGAPYREVHRDKALVHTWLSWQDEPGAQLHMAIKRRILDSDSPNADGFVAWFRGLFEV